MCFRPNDLLSGRSIGEAASRHAGRPDRRLPRCNPSRAVLWSSGRRRKPGYWLRARRRDRERSASSGTKGTETKQKKPKILIGTPGFYAEIVTGEDRDIARKIATNVKYIIMDEVSLL